MFSSRSCGPEPETADAAVTTLLGLRSLAVTVVCLAHVSKTSADSKGPARPFGSVYVQNLARSVIEARRSEVLDGDEPGFTLSLYHRKSNHGRLAGPSALRFAFDEAGALRVTRGEADLAGGSVAVQVLDALRTGRSSPGELAEQLGANERTVKSALQRLDKAGKVTRLESVSGGRGHKSLWGLRSGSDDGQLGN